MMQRAYLLQDAPLQSSHSLIQPRLSELRCITYPSGFSQMAQLCINTVRVEKIEQPQTLYPLPHGPPAIQAQSHRRSSIPSSVSVLRLMKASRPALHESLFGECDWRSYFLASERGQEKCFRMTIIQCRIKVMTIRHRFLLGLRN